MSGYLARLVHQAKAPAPSSGIHPLVRSIYAPPASISSPPMESVQEVKSPAMPSASSSAQPSPTNPSASLNSNSNDIAQVMKPGEDHLAHRPPAEDPDFRSISSRREPAYETVFPDSVNQAQTVRPDFPNGEAVRPLQPSESSATSAASHVSQVFEAPKQTQTETFRNFQPLMPRQARPAASPSMQASPTPQSFTGDEIHINIGRIEVTAVPQAPAARPAPRAQRRSFNLDEYLRKADGRGL